MDALRVARAGGACFSTFGNVRLPSVDCTIRNMSETGAALELEIPAGIADDFDF